MPAIRHVFPAKHTKSQHLLGREIGIKFRIEVASDWRNKFVPIARLHPVIDGDGSSHVRLAVCYDTSSAGLFPRAFCTIRSSPYDARLRKIGWPHLLA